MKPYNEYPPRLTKDKVFIDEMVNTYIDLLIMQEATYKIILALENDEPTMLTHASIEACYKMLEDREGDKEQISMLVMNGGFTY